MAFEDRTVTYERPDHYRPIVVATAEAAILPVTVAEPISYLSHEEEVRLVVERHAKHRGVSADRMMKVIACETGHTYDSSLQSFVPVRGGPNGREDSWGLAQIHLPSHPYLTKEDATDPEFAIAFMAEKFSLGQAYLWTCYYLTQ